MNVNESSIESIKGLIKYRYKFDPTYNEEEAMIHSDSNPEEYKINYEAIHTYVTLDRHIAKANLNKEQIEILRLYSSGYTEDDVAQIINKKQKVIHGIIKTICKKIYDEAIEEWKNYVNLNIVKTKYEYKQCSRCNEWKPKNEKYFSPKLDAKDGFHPYCKKCR